jgi:hypothetical protein
MLGMGSVFGITDDDVIAEVMFFFRGKILAGISLSNTLLCQQRARFSKGKESQHLAINRVSLHPSPRVRQIRLSHTISNNPAAYSSQNGAMLPSGGRRYMRGISLHVPEPDYRSMLSVPGFCHAAAWFHPLEYAMSEIVRGEVSVSMHSKK